jgi:hypothetical protein
MGKLVIVKNDPVQGTDKHNVSGVGPNPAAPPPTLPYIGIGDFSYIGRITGGLSDFMRIGDEPVAVVKSQSSLDPGQDTPSAGKHSGPAGSNFVPMPSPVPPTQAAKPTPLGPPMLMITDNIGSGAPNSAAGSQLVTVGGAKLLLDGDEIDTCSGVGAQAGSTVTAKGQSFVTCSE